MGPNILGSGGKLDSTRHEKGREKESEGNRAHASKALKIPRKGHATVNNFLAKRISSEGPDMIKLHEIYRRLRISKEKDATMYFCG